MKKSCFFGIFLRKTVVFFYKSATIKEKQLCFFVNLLQCKEEFCLLLKPDGGSCMMDFKNSAMKLFKTVQQ